MGSGSPPEDGQEVEFHYSAYNENGSRVDTSFSKGKPAKTRMGIKGLIPGALIHWASRTARGNVLCMLLA